MKINSHAQMLPAVLLLLSVLTLAAQIPVTSTPVTNRFDAQPPSSQWSTRSQGGGATTITDAASADAQVQTNTAALAANPLASTSGSAPAATTEAVWSSAGFVQTRATGNAATWLQATLQNTTGYDAGLLTVIYEFTALSPVTEQVPGHRAYFSLTGAMNSWTVINDFSSGTTGAKSVAFNLTNWTNGALLYLLWLDDNGSGSPDTACQIDNFAVSFAAGPARVVTPPASQSAAPGGPVALSVLAGGAPPIFFQWRKEGNDLANATNATLNFASAQLSDAGDYTVVVSNALGWATSVVATLTVACADAAAILTQPTNQFLAHGGTIQLAVTASGTAPLSFQWHRDGTPLAGATNRTFIKTNAVQADSGNYFVIVSNCAATVTSEVAVVSIPAPPVVLLGLTNTFWKYNQSGADLGTAWRDPAYDDSGWPSGRGVLAVEDNALVTPLMNTTLSLTGTNGSAVITYYFRTHFTLTNEAAAVQLVSSNLIDDGAVAYLNGTEVFRFNLPSTAISAGTQASAAAGEGQFFLTNFPPGVVLQGDNVLAVEVHQAGSTSSDVVFGLALIAQSITPTAPAITEEPASLSLFRGQDANLVVTAESGSPVSYQWFQNGLAIGSATNRILLLTNAAFEQAGFYQVMLTNAYGATTSRVCTLSVLGEDSRLRLVEFTNVWRFNATGTNLGTVWRAPGYDETAWPNGQGVFWRSFSPGFPEPTNTVLPLLAGSGNSITTFYFRAHFALPPGSSNVVLVSSNLLDDGAVYYLNGLEAGRIRLTGPVSATTLASIAGSDGRGREVLQLAATNLVPGDNVLAVEVHQGSTNSSDVVFGMSLTAYGAYPQGLLILSPLASQSVPEGLPAGFFADVLGGQPLACRWFRNGVLLVAETNASLSIAALHSATAGEYFFIASNSFGSVTSAVAALTMISDVAAPTLLSAVGTNQLQGILVTFSEAVTAQSATNLANYSLAPGISLLSATLLAPDVVLLTTSGLDLLSDYTLTVSNIFDLADVPNVIEPGTSARVQPNRLRVATGLLQVQTVFIILMENKRWSEIKGSTNAPYINSLLPLAASSESYTAPGNLHPSQPNYLWLEAGDHFGHVNDNGPAVSRVTSTNHLSTQLAAAGIEWRGYMESMPYGSTGVTNATPYLARHNPFAFFDDVTTNYDYCTNHVRPYDEFAGDLAAGRIGRYNFLTPNITNDMHNFAPGSTSLVRQGDNWLAWELPRILSSAAYSNNGAVVITWDENDYTDDPAIGMIVLSPLAKAGHASTVPYDHSSTLRTMQEIFGVRPYLGAAAGASPLNDLFKDLSLRIAPSNGVAGVWLENVLPGRTNYVQASTDLLQWTTIATNAATNAVFIADPAPAPQKFYRAVEIP